MNAGDLVEFKQISENGSNEGPLAIGTIVDFDSDGDPIVMVWFIDPETNEATGQNEWRVRNVDYQKLTIILLAEVQKLRAEIEELKA